jgi:hypothetical protein
MRRLGFLGMARLLTPVFLTIIESTALISAVELTSPALDHWLVGVGDMRDGALLRLSTISAKDVLLNLTAIAACWHTLFASPAVSFMATPLAYVLSTIHGLSADLAAAPAAVVVRLRALHRDLMLAAKAGLRWSHICARWTRPSMASQRALVRAFSCSLPSACLPT